jgi:predicted transposase YdaD
LDVLLSSSRAATEKKKILEEEFGVTMSEELEEVLIMCNLSQGVKAEGREEGRIEGRKEGRKEGRREGRKEGISIGEIGMLVQLVQDGDLKLERAAEKAKMTVEEFKKVMENTSNQEI